MTQLTTLVFPIAPAQTAIPLAPDVDLFSSDLAGLPLVGQLLALECVFPDGIVARVNGPPFLSVGLRLYTDTPGFPGFPGPGTGYLLDAADQPITDAAILGSAMADDGSVI